MLQAFLTDLLSNRLKPWLNLTSEQMVSDFAAHVGWSLAIPLAAHALAGDLGLYIVCFLWAAESLYWKFVERDHWNRLRLGLDDANTILNLKVNLASRLTLPAIAVLYTLFK